MVTSDPPAPQKLKKNRKRLALKVSKKGMTFQHSIVYVYSMFYISIYIHTSSSVGLVVLLKGPFLRSIPDTSDAIAQSKHSSLFPMNFLMAEQKIQELALTVFT